MTEKNGPKSVADIVGMPDDADKENIRNILKNYDRKNPGFLAHTISEAKEDQKNNSLTDFGITNKQAGGRIVLELPEEVHRLIQEAYPLIFSDKKHFRWFTKNFRELLIPEKY